MSSLKLKDETKIEESLYNVAYRKEVRFTKRLRNK